MVSGVGKHFYYELSFIQAMERVRAILSAEKLLQIYLKQGISLFLWIFACFA